MMDFNWKGKLADQRRDAPLTNDLGQGIRLGRDEIVGQSFSSAVWLKVQ